MKTLLFRLPVLCALLHCSTVLASVDRQVSTSGSCNRIATPDRGQVTMTAEAQDRDLQAAARKATQLYERALSAVKRLDLEAPEFRTVEYNLGEVREWQKDKLVSKGFKARIGLQISTSSIQKLGDVIAIGAREELKDISGMTTYLSPEKLKKEHFACLQEASEDARSKAQKLSESLGAHLGEVLTISESYNEPARPRPMMGVNESSAPMAAKSVVPPPSIEAGQQELSVNVQATFGLR
jgi:uncharacterized protein YggE